MADEAFALSPISARAAQPREEDYDAISEAFMETSRGRWFLGEYAKRNRNTDTRMVLDAVARIEQSLAAQKQPEPEPVPDTGLADALSAIKAALNEARAAASAAVDNLALEQHLAPVRKGARVIREISWRWREIGADGRICDLLDSQVSAIEASCGQLSSADPQIALSAAFDLIGSSIAAFDEDGDAPVHATVETTAEAAASPSPAPSNEMPAATALPPPAQAEAKAETPANEAEAVVASQLAPAPALPVEEAVAETITDVEVMEVAPETSDMTAEAIAPIADPAAELTPEAADAHDEAVLDMIAAEMAAPDDSDDDFGSEPAEMQLDDPPSSEPEMMAAPPETIVAPQIVAAMAQAASPAPQAAIEPAPEPEPSLGSTLLANGFLRKPAPGPDPLAAIRRLSQIEKIALFS